MALKRKINKTEYEALKDDLKAEYKASGSDYVLDTDDASELLAARDNEKAERRKAEKRAKDLQDELDELNDKKSRESGDIEALEKSWKDKFDKEKARADKAEADLTSERQDRHVSGEAKRIAGRFTVPSLMEDRIAKRLQVEIHDGKPVVRVLDKDGKPSAMNVGDLEKEFVDNPEFKSIVIASKASGSGSTDRPTSRLSGGSAPNSQSNNNGPADLSKLPAKDLVEHMRSKIGDQDS